jgi:acetyltransferase
VGGLRDPEFGPVVLAGFGGVLVEATRDVQLAVAPVDTDQALALLRSLRGAAVFTGLRGSPPTDLGPVANVIVAVGDLMARHPEISELDLNPVLAGPGGCIAVDWRILAGLPAKSAPPWASAGQEVSRGREESSAGPGLRSWHSESR